MLGEEHQNIFHDGAPPKRESVTRRQQFLEGSHAACGEEIQVASGPGARDVVARQGIGRREIDNHDPVGEALRLYLGKFVKRLRDEIERAFEKSPLASRTPKENSGARKIASIKRSAAMVFPDPVPPVMIECALPRYSSGIRTDSCHSLSPRSRWGPGSWASFSSNAPVRLRET